MAKVGAIRDKKVPNGPGQTTARGHPILLSLSDLNSEPIFDKAFGAATMVPRPVGRLPSHVRKRIPNEQNSTAYFHGLCHPAAGGSV